MEQLEQFYNSLPPELQEKIAMLEPEEQQQVLMELIQRQQAGQSQYAQIGANVQREKVPVEAERNETVTVQDGQQPNVQGGYLKKLSDNPVTGQATYEIPDNQHNNTHDEIGNGSGTTGVNMHLKEGDVVNSDKTVIPANMIIMGRNFKGKTFKDASDFISKKETEIQKEYEKNVKKGKVDKVSESSITLMLAKLGNHRNQLNELQELALSHKEKKENGMKRGGSVYAEPGVKVGERIPYILDFQMPNLKFDDLSKGKPSPKIPDNVKDRMVNVYKAEYPVINAANGVTASVEKVRDFANRIQGAGNGPTPMQDIVAAFRQSGLGASSPAQNIPSVAGFDLGTVDVEPSKVKNPSKEIMSKIVSASSEQGIDPTMMLTFAEIESGFKPNAISKTGATGIYQFTKGTGQQYGLIEDGEDKRFDANANIAAGIKLAKDNSKTLQSNGIEINPTNLYLAHQLGAGGVIDIYNSINTGQPLSEQTRKNMGLNFGTSSPVDYLTKTAKLIMSKYKSFEDILNKTQEESDYDAFSLKQKYQLSEPVADISGEIIKSGIDNVMKKIKQGNFKVSVPQPTQQEDQSAYQKFGGYINHGYNISVPGPELMGRRKDYLMDGNYSEGGSIMPHGYNIDVPGPELMGKRRDYLMDANYSRGGYVAPHGYNISVPGPELMGKRHDYLMDGNYAVGGSIYAQSGKKVGTSSTGYTLVQNLEKQPQRFTDLVGTDYNNWTRFIGDVLKNQDDPDVKEAVGKATDISNKYKSHKGDWLYWANDLKAGNVHEAFLPLYEKWTNKQVPPPVDFTINPATLQSEVTQPSTGTILNKLDIIPRGMGDQTVASTTGGVDLTGITGEYPPAPSESELVGPGITTKSLDKSRKKGSDILGRIQYGIGEALPYLSNLRLLREQRIMPTLQQKPYQNPYENLSTDYSIQSALSDIDRSTLTAMADERGNPSVRSARLAQIAANAAAAKAPLYTEKYNREQQLQTAKTLGLYDYLNKFTDTNMALKKRYEQEVLQTIENQRQQQNAALDKMANDYLRGKENKQALELATMNTNYVWNPYSQKLEFVPEKAKENATWLQEIIKLKGTGTSSSKSKKSEEEASSDIYKKVEKDGKVTFEKVTSKYGSTVKGKKKLSLKNYY